MVYFIMDFGTSGSLTYSTHSPTLPSGSHQCIPCIWDYLCLIKFVHLSWFLDFIYKWCQAVFVLWLISPSRFICVVTNGKISFYLWVIFHCVCMYANDISDKGLISKIYKELIQLNIKRANQLKNGQRIWIDNFPKKTYRWPADSEWSIWRYWTSLIIGERQTKYLIRCLQMMYLQGVNIHTCIYTPPVLHPLMDT